MSIPWNPNAQLYSLRFYAMISLLHVAFFAYHAFANAFSVWLPEASLLPLNIFKAIPFLWAVLTAASSIKYYNKAKQCGGGNLKEFLGLYDDELAKSIYQKAATRMAASMACTALLLFFMSTELAPYFPQWSLFLNGVTVTSICLSVGLLAMSLTILSELVEDEPSEHIAN